jgi:type I restriction enzyme M protein
MILNGDGHGGITQGNTLRTLADLPADFRLHPNAPGAVRPTVVLTNPPFGASHELRVKDRDVLRHFELGHVWTEGPDRWMRRTDTLNDGDGVPPEILFLERCIDWLAPGGRLAIVLARGVLDNRDALPARQYVLTHTRLLGVLNCHPNTFAPFNGTKAAVLIVQKKDQLGFQHDEEYPVFMAISQRIGQDSQGREIYKRTVDGSFTIEHGQRVLEHDMAELRDAWRAFRSGRPIRYEAAWSVPLSRILQTPDWRFNPVRYAPDAERAVAQVMELADSKEWRVERLGDFAAVFNGPRFKRPFADEGVKSGPYVVRMYTPKAMFEERGESCKYLDLSRARPEQRRAVDALRLRRDYIMIVDSGTAGKLLGRVTMTTSVHEGAIGNNNLIRVIIDDPVLRDYIYEFLRSELGQRLLLRNVYGTNQDHIEPDDVKDVHIPIPRDLSTLEAISKKVRDSVEFRERAVLHEVEAEYELSRLMQSALSLGGDDAVQEDNDG